MEQGTGVGAKVGVGEGVNRLKICPFGHGGGGVHPCLDERCAVYDVLAKCCGFLLLAVGVSRLTARVGGELADFAARLSEAILARER